MKTKEELKDFYQKLYYDQHIPFTIERVSDKKVLYLNNDYRTYSYESLPNYTGKVYRYTYRRLFADIRVNEGDFNVVGWAPIGNVFSNPKQYFIQEFQKTELDAR